MTDDADTWTDKDLPALPVAVAGAGVVAWDQWIFVVGGRTPKRDAVFVDVWRLDIVSKQWHKCTPLANPRESTSCIAHQGKIYILSGMKFSQVYDDMLIYDIANDCYLPPVSLPTRLLHSGICGIDNALYVSGGVSEEGSLRGCLFQFDITTQEWREFPSFHLSRSHHVVCQLAVYRLITADECTKSTTRHCQRNARSY